MKTTAVVLLLATLCSGGVAFAAAAETNPLGAVFELIDGLRAKILKEGDLEAKAYKDFYEWCDESSANLGFSVKSATERKGKLEAKIGELNSDIQVGTSKIDDLVAAISDAESELKTATPIRKQEAIDFAASEKELTSTIDTLDRAIAILEKEMATSSAAFAQIDTKSLASVVQSLSTVVEAAGFSSADRQKLTALVQTQQEDEQSEDEEEPGAPAAAKYENNSGNIVDVLENLKEKAEAELADARKAESESKQNFALLKQALNDKTKADKQALAEEKAGVAEAKEELGVATGDLSTTSEELKNTEDTLDKTRADCMRAATDYEASVAAMKEEIKVIDEAKEILKKSTGGADEQTYSFLQESATGSSKLARIENANAEVVAIVKKLAKAHHSTALNQLASKIATVVRYQASEGEDPFAKVKSLITEMLAKLSKEMAAEATEKAYCDEEMSKTEKKKADLENQVDKVSSRIDKAASRSADLKEKIVTLQAELAETAKNQAEMDEVRTKSHAAYSVAKADLVQGLGGVRKALGVLRDFYGGEEGGAAMLQDFGAFMQQPKAPESAEKATGAGQSIISILEVVESDFATHLSKIETQESDESATYEEITQENKVATASKSTDVKLMTGQVASLDKRIAEMTSDKDSVSTELKAVLEYYGKIRQRCIAKPESYEERKKRRDAEIAGLKEALSVLENDTAFFQKRRRGRRHAAFMQIET